MPTVSSAFDRSGPILDFKIGVSEPYRRALISSGRVPPPDVIVPMIIDTGADTTLVHDHYMRALGIPPRGRRRIVTSTTASGVLSELDTYDISIRLVAKGEDKPFLLKAVEAFAAPLHPGGAEGMIGRDVLHHLTLTLEGPGSRFRLSWV